MNGKISRWLALLGVVIISGCASSTPPRLYLLTPLEADEAEPRTRAIAQQRLSLGVGPVRVSEYLNRPQIVTRVAPNNITLGEFDQWSEPLASNIARVLALNLSLLTGSGEVMLFPWRAKTVPYQIPVRVLRFDGTLGGQCTLVAAWRILETKSDRTLLMRTSRFESQAAGSDYNALVAAMNDALAALSREIAAEVADIERQN